ncbi:MAG TPA: hypothetical protein VEY91_05890 [Candidatus Limnocylindria bacterium]|nr:hypothetical protein [Candidatus Limnocylindria bacterium]
MVDLASFTPGATTTPLWVPTVQALVNPGFETGALAPWTTSAWVATGADAFTGSFSAEVVGNEWIRQDFAPIDVSNILLISLYSREPDGAAIQAIDFFYGPNDFDEFLIFPPHDWTAADVTAQLRGTGSLSAIRIWGYSTGGSLPDLTRIDDIVIDVGSTASGPRTWGAVKRLYR